MRTFRQIDVFGYQPLAGNPLAVVADADGVTGAQMQAFARWTNLSETTFLLAPTDLRADYRARIFTPDGELPFAGHPTLGSCHAWLETAAPDHVGDRIIQECAAGLVELRQTEHGLAFSAPPLRRSGPLEDRATRHIAALLRIRESDILDGAWVDNGPGWAGVLLRDADAVLALSPDAVDLDIGVVGPHSAGAPADFEVRAFYPKNRTTGEDPVTGSLNAGLAQWLIADGRAIPPYTVRQGTAIGHDGRVYVSQDEQGIWIGGATTTLVNGMVAL